MKPDQLLQTLQLWRDAGWLRSLDLALARFIHERCSNAPASLLLAAALVAQLEGRGHSALPLAALRQDAEALFGWPAEGTAALRAALAAGKLDAPGTHAEWAACAVVERDPTDDSGSSPLVLRSGVAGGLLYLRRYWRYESRVAAQIHARSATKPAVWELGPDMQAAQELLDRLFPASDAASEATNDIAAGPDLQKAACLLALQNRLTLITGGPGTGKTYTAARLLVLLQTLHPGPAPLRVALAAPTGKAAARLRQSIQKALQGLREQAGETVPLGTWATQLEPARTLHALLGTQPGTRRFRHDAARPLEVDVLFVDEASMVHLEMMAQLLEAMPADARVVLLGDKDQLSSVEAGAVMGDLCQAPALRKQTVMLLKSHRFDGPIGQLALAINRGDAAAALQLLQASSAGQVALVHAVDATAVLPLALKGRPGAVCGYRAYLELLAQRPDRQTADAAKATRTADAADATFTGWAKAVLRRFDSFRVLCALREGPWGVTGLNAAIERALAETRLLSRRGEWYEGRPVMVTRNDAALGVFNGDVGIVLRAPAADAGLRCYFLDGDDLRSVSVGRLADVETAFAMTVHKSQGSEFEHVLLVLPDEDSAVLTREWLYTGITRASLAFTLLSRQVQPLAAATGRLTHRVSGLRELLG